MIMQSLLNASDVRSNFGSFIDNTVRVKPQAVKRNRDVIFSVSKEHLREMLSAYEFTIEYEQDEKGSFVGSINQVEDIVGEGETMEDLRLDLARQLIDYAADYYDDFTRYYNSPNRRKHANYILRVLIEDDVDKVEKLLHA